MPRKLDLPEYEKLRVQFKAAPHNFSQFFVRDNEGNILVKDEVDPKSTTPSGDLTGTLPSEGGGEGIDTPTGQQMDPLDALRLMMKDVSTRAKQSATKTGLETVFGGFAEEGITPEKVPGSFVKGIIDFVDGHTGPRIADSLEEMNIMIDGVANQRQNVKDDAAEAMTNAQGLMGNAISSGMWENMDPAQQQNLWTLSGYTGVPVETTPDTTFIQTEENGKLYNVVLDSKTGEVINKVVIGAAKQKSGGGSDTTPPSQKDFSFTGADMTALIGAGFSKEDVTSIEGFINDGYTINDIINDENVNLSSDQVNSLRTTMGAEVSENMQVINKDFIKSIFDPKELPDIAEDAGFKAGHEKGWFQTGSGEEGVNNFLDSLMKTVNQYRQLGYEDKEIIDMIKEKYGS